MPTARGPCDITVEAEPPFLEQDGIELNRNMVRKQFCGDMVGRSEAQMVAAYTATPGSAGYVAIEHFTGSVAGRSGSFVAHGRILGTHRHHPVPVRPSWQRSGRHTSSSPKV